MESFGKKGKTIIFPQDVIELLIVIENDKFRINESKIKHFTRDTKFLGGKSISRVEFYKFVNYLVSISNEWDDEFLVGSVSPEARWNILIKTADNVTKRYAGIEYCPNNWHEFYNHFVAFLNGEEIIENDNNNNNTDFSYEKNINQEFNNNGITYELVNLITRFVIEIIEEYKQDRFWSDSARSFLGLLILSNLTNGNKIDINNLLEQTKDENAIKNIILSNIDKLKNDPSLRVFTTNVEIVNSDKPLKSVMQLAEEGLNKYAKNHVQEKDSIDEQKEIGSTKKFEDDDDDDEYYNMEKLFPFTEFSEIDINDDEADDFELVCGIRIETNYGPGKTEQLNVYEIGKGNTFGFNGVTEIQDITKDEVVIRTKKDIVLKGVKCKLAEDDKIDIRLKVNEFVTGYCTRIIPIIAYYKVKVIYVRKKKRNKICLR